MPPLLSPDPGHQDEEQERVFDTGPGAVTAEGAALLLPKHRDKEMNLLPHSALSSLPNYSSRNVVGSTPFFVHHHHHYTSCNVQPKYVFLLFLSTGTFHISPWLLR